MYTSSEAIQLLQEAITKTQAANNVITNLAIEHDYQDVAILVAQAGAALLECAALLMDKRDEDAFEALDQAEDLLDEVYKIIDGETDEDE